MDNKVTFLNVKSGKLTTYNSSEELDQVTGLLGKITQKEREFNGEKVIYWYLRIRSEKANYIIGFPYSSGVFKSIILSLAGDEVFNAVSKITIRVYEKDGKSKAIVLDGDKKLDWIKRELPPLQEVKVGSRVIKDDTERMNFITELVNEINTKVA